MESRVFRTGAPMVTPGPLQPGPKSEVPDARQKLLKAAINLRQTSQQDSIISILE